MAIFFHDDVRELLSDKKVIVIGDSIQRSVYKDLVCLWTQNDSRYLYQGELRAKGELSFLGDKLLRGGKLEGKMVNGIGYREVREFREENTVFKYYFVTRCYSEHMASVMNELKTCQPDVIVMNSTFWDIHHYGDSDLQQYKANLNNLLKGITEMFSTRCLFIWNAALPLADRCKGGFLRKGFLTIPLEKIKTANKLAWLAAGEHQKVYLDLFCKLGNSESFQQAADGIHWGMRAHRKISNLILSEVCTAWNRKIPDPPPVPNRAESVNSSPLPWSSYYPDTGDPEEWNSSPQSYSDGYELEYWNYVDERFYNSPAYDGYRSPSPHLYGETSPYGNSWGSVGWEYLSPVGNYSQREREYQPIQSPFPLIQKRYFPPNFNFYFTPQGPYYQENIFKPSAYYSDPLPSQSFNPLMNRHFLPSAHKGQGLLPTPPGPPSFGASNKNNVSSSYRDRFKKLSKPSFRGRRNRTSSTITVSTPQNPTQSVRESVACETPLSVLSSSESNTGGVVNENPSANLDSAPVNGLGIVVECSDLNNNEKQSVPSNAESASKENIESVVTGGVSLNDRKSPDGTDVAGLATELATPNPPGQIGNRTGMTNSVKQETLSEELSQEHQVKGGVKRKRDEEEESNTDSKPIKVPREDDEVRCTLFYDNFI